MKSNLPPVPSGANQLATRRFLITGIIHMLKWPTTRPPYQRRRRGLAIRALLCQNLLLTLHPTSTPCAVKRNGGWEVLHKKAYINAYSWLSENLAIFRITVKDSATVDATGMYIPIRLISSLMLEMSLGYSHIRRGVFVAQSTVMGQAKCLWKRSEQLLGSRFSFY